MDLSKMSVKHIDKVPQATDQADKFRGAARELGCDEDEFRWKTNLRKVAAHKPAPEADEKVGKPE